MGIGSIDDVSTGKLNVSRKRDKIVSDRKKTKGEKASKRRGKERQGRKGEKTEEAKGGAKSSGRRKEERAPRIHLAI